MWNMKLGAHGSKQLRLDSDGKFYRVHRKRHYAHVDCPGVSAKDRQYSVTDIQALRFHSTQITFVYLTAGEDIRANCSVNIRSRT